MPTDSAPSRQENWRISWSWTAIHWKTSRRSAAYSTSFWVASIVYRKGSSADGTTGKRPARCRAWETCMSATPAKFVGIQISPISFIDEGTEPLLDTLQQRFGINVLLVGTISWLGLKVGRRISWQLEGWPDHGPQQPSPLTGGSYIAEHPQYYRNTLIQDFRSRDPEL